MTFPVSDCSCFILAIKGSLQFSRRKKTPVYLLVEAPTCVFGEQKSSILKNSALFQYLGVRQWTLGLSMPQGERDVSRLWQIASICTGNLLGTPSHTLHLEQVEISQKSLYFCEILSRNSLSNFSSSLKQVGDGMGAELVLPPFSRSLSIIISLSLVLGP